MTLRQRQSIFAKNIALLIIWAFDNGYEITGGEWLRPDAMQQLYFKTRKSKVQTGQHQKKLAFDINLFIDGEYKPDKESHEKLGEYWKSLHPDNRWGGDWGWDANHYEMKG